MPLSLKARVEALEALVYATPWLHCELYFSGVPAPQAVNAIAIAESILSPVHMAMVEIKRRFGQLEPAFMIQPPVSERLGARDGDRNLRRGAQRRISRRRRCCSSTSTTPTARSTP